MLKSKTRNLITIDCSTCKNNNLTKGIFNYVTIKNRKNTLKPLILSKFCKFCKHHTLFIEKK